MNLTASNKMLAHVLAVDKFTAMDYGQKLELTLEFKKQFPELQASALNLVEYLKIKDEK